MNDIFKQTVSFLASFKIFSFNITFFLFFGIALLFLSQSICIESSICGLIKTGNSSYIDLLRVDFSGYENGIRTFVFSYIWGLLLWAFARLSFSKRIRQLFNRRTKENVEEKEKPTGDVDIYIFLGKKEASFVADVHFLNLFQSSIVRLLFGFITFSIIFFSNWTYLVFLTIAASIIILLFVLNIIADQEVNSFGQQIQNRIAKDEENQQE